MAEIIAAATGRRKTAVARVTLVSGEGKCTVNRKPLEEYVTDEASRIFLMQPLKIAGVETKYDVVAWAKGGGSTGQIGAVRHGLARALCEADASLRAALKAAGCLTRDPRMKERKKPGLRGARRRFQFSKR
ncbi:MAG: 30S ribosomal protein S9 [Kiritimatiellae bacterium]|nr:30S ribosomal protein S9 [Kiritimatiellia bacterium]MBR1837671.1 30S ribosomal protein S9 [Kiritimatiellia bacterium]